LIFFNQRIKDLPPTSTTDVTQVQGCSRSSHIYSAVLADILIQVSNPLGPNQNLATFHQLIHHLLNLDQSSHQEVSSAAAFDWLALSLHSGSSLTSEYGQSKPSESHLFATVLAFNFTNFCFWDASMTQLSHTLAIVAQHHAFKIHIHF
jgi:hypothetical protein